VLTEKLMAHNITECKQMIKAAQEAHKLLAVGHQRHYSVLYENANELVRAGLLGDIKFIRASWHRNNSFPNSDSWFKPVPKEDEAALASKVKEFGYDSVEQLCRWRLYNKTGGGLMAELGSHQLDACSIFLGKVHPIAVSGYGGKNFYGVKGVGSKDKQTDPREIDDHVYITVEFPGPHYQEDKNDIVIVTYSSINTNRMELYGETLFGSRGTMIVEQEQNVMLFKEAGGGQGGGPGQKVQVVQPEKGKPVMNTADTQLPSTAVAAGGGGLGKVSRGYTEEMEHFCHCIREGIFETPQNGGLRCSGTVAMADAIMALTANLAMKHRKRIVFKDEWFDPQSPAVPETDSEVLA
jgi:predicted dehydrogenase